MAGSQGRRRLTGAALWACPRPPRPRRRRAWHRGASSRPPQYPGVSTAKDVPIVMRDGTRLYGRRASPEAPLGPEPGAAGRACVAKRAISYRVPRPRRARIVSIAAFPGKRRVALRRGRNLRSITLRRPPRGRYRVRLVTRDSRGHRRVTYRRVSNC